LSSAILYLAIVAIWAVVLVPRWLRPRAAPPQPVPVPVPAESAKADLREPAGPGQDAGADLLAGRDGPDVAGEPAGGAAVAGVSGEDARDDEAAPETEVAAPSSAARRAEVLKARRRLLTTLIALTVIAAGLAVTHIDAYWIVIPPTILLTGYLVLLREFAHIDTERARRAARIRRADAAASQEQAQAATPAVGGPDLRSDPPVAPRGAEIIDISGRIGDQVYDQYSDAANRAVGD
jgi:hypothetical protein